LKSESLFRYAITVSKYIPAALATVLLGCIHDLELN
jgi:hypothetical protein